MQACLASFSELSLAGPPEFAVGAVPFSAMSLIRWPWPVGSRGSDAEVAGGFHRAMLAFGAVGAAVGGMRLVAGPAGVVADTDLTLGTMILGPTSGSGTTTTTWSTTAGGAGIHHPNGRPG